jgi:hypothetical protein
MTPHSANPHEGPAQQVILPRLAASQPPTSPVEPGESSSGSAASDPTSSQVVSTTGWSPTAWRLGQR